MLDPNDLATVLAFRARMRNAATALQRDSTLVVNAWEKQAADNDTEAMRQALMWTLGGAGIGGGLGGLLGLLSSRKGTKRRAWEDAVTGALLGSLGGAGLGALGSGVRGLASGSPTPPPRPDLLGSIQRVAGLIDSRLGPSKNDYQYGAATFTPDISLARIGLGAGATGVLTYLYQRMRPEVFHGFTDLPSRAAATLSRGNFDPGGRSHQILADATQYQLATPRWRAWLGARYTKPGGAPVTAAEANLLRSTMTPSGFRRFIKGPGIAGFLGGLGVELGANLINRMRGTPTKS